MKVGFEWLVDVENCDADALRNEEILRNVFMRIISDLKLKTLGAPLWHKFGGEGGVTGLVMLTESHLACHTYPEYKSATFNLYCCKSRPEWNWEENLKKFLGAEIVRVVRIERGTGESVVRSPQSIIEKQSAVGSRQSAGSDQKSKTKNQKPKINFAEGSR